MLEPAFKKNKIPRLRFECNEALVFLRRPSAFGGCRHKGRQSWVFNLKRSAPLWSLKVKRPAYRGERMEVISMRTMLAHDVDPTCAHLEFSALKIELE